MAQTKALVKALKDVLRARGITYARLAKTLGLSEASVKRVFASGSFTLSRLDQVCEALGMEITDLAKMVSRDAEGSAFLTREQEKELVSDPKLLLVAVHALNHWTLKEIVEVYAITTPQCIELLARLDRLGIIELLPDNRFRLRVARSFAWLPDGPIQQYFRAQVQNDYFRSRFDGDGELMMFVNGMLSAGSNAALQSRMRRLSAEFSELHDQDLAMPRAQRSGTSLLIALRPWSPQFFVQMRRDSRGAKE